MDRCDIGGWKQVAVQVLEGMSKLLDGIIWRKVMFLKPIFRGQNAGEEIEPDRSSAIPGCKNREDVCEVESRKKDVNGKVI